MGDILTREEVEAHVREVTSSLPRDACRTCDCFQGFLTQLEIDCEDDVSDITGTWKVGREGMHGCLGCKPCPPGAVFAQYLNAGQRKRG